ncbi:hypothetical protein ACTFIV_003108 [Dictyostelium citrinum]
MLIDEISSGRDVLYLCTQTNIEYYKICGQQLMEECFRKRNLLCLSNPEILAWNIKYRNYDLESGRCIQPTNKTLFSYLFHSNQFSKALNEIDYFNNAGERDHRNFIEIYEQNHHLLSRYFENDLGLTQVKDAFK